MPKDLNWIEFGLLVFIAFFGGIIRVFRDTSFEQIKRKGLIYLLFLVASGGLVATFCGVLAYAMGRTLSLEIYAMIILCGAAGYNSGKFLEAVGEQTLSKVGLAKSNANADN